MKNIKLKDAWLVKNNSVEKGKGITIYSPNNKRILQ